MASALSWRCVLQEGLTMGTVIHKSMAVFVLSLFFAGQGYGGFPASVNSGSEIMTNGTHVAALSLGYLAGFISNPTAKNSVGYFNEAVAAY
jgi:hypothetical protein